MTPIRLRKLTKQYARNTAVDAIDLDIELGELFFLIGPSGCGKSTVLRMIAGLTEPTSGQVLLGDRDVTHVPARERNTAMVFQGYALWPHMTVAENVAFGLDVRQVPKQEKSQRIQKALESVRLGHLADRRPGQLSGGEQQRVALARAIVVDPAVLLLDEPLSNLDANLRLELRKEVKRVCTETGITAIYVTHDQSEALSMAARIGVMQNGKLRRLGTPREIYHDPKSKFVAKFLGQTNFIEVSVKESNASGAQLDSPMGRIHTSQNLNGTVSGQRLNCAVRPESLRILQNGDVAHNAFDAKVTEMVYLGSATECVVELSGAVSLVLLTVNQKLELGKGQNIRIGFDPSDVVVLTD